MEDVFAPLPQHLPPSREVDFEIWLEPDRKTANQRAYPVPLRLRDECRKQISDLLKRTSSGKALAHGVRPYCLLREWQLALVVRQ
jgi:hypothetical protein